MAIDFTTTELIASVKRRASIPTSQALMLPADFVAFLSEEMHSVLIPAIHAVREEYFVTSKDDVLVADQAAYAIPTRAVGNMLRDVVLVDSGGSEIELPRLDPEFLKQENSFTDPDHAGFYLKDASVILVPTPVNVNGLSLRQKYERRPNNLCQKSAAVKITAINTVTKVVTVTNMPTAFTASLTYDVINGNPPFNTIADDQVVTLIAGFDMTFSALPTGLAVGQWIAESMYSPIPQLPYEGHLVLAQLCAAKILEGMTDHPGLDDARTKAGEMLRSFLDIINPRVQGATKKIVNRSGPFHARIHRGWQ